MNKAISLLLLLAAVPLSAQEPVTHTVNFPSGDAAWTVNIERLNKAAPKPEGSPFREVKSVDIVRKGSLRHDTLQWSDGSTSEYWWSFSPAVVMFRAKPSEPILSVRPGHLGSRSFDASNFSWVGPETFQKMEVVGGKPHRIYRIKVQGDESAKIFIAGIDGETGIPVTWSDQNTQATFEFKDPPTEPLKIPAEYRKELERIAQKLAPVKPLGKR